MHLSLGAGVPLAEIDHKQIRLTYNYWRKGGYQIGSEDYRWEIVQKYVSRPVFFVFNIIFISFIQSVSPPFSLHYHLPPVNICRCSSSL